jgi:ubiquitin-conjugating enzyme E2 O
VDCSTVKFYQQDIVQRIAPPNSFGIVLVRTFHSYPTPSSEDARKRCWHDAEDVPSQSLDAMMRSLKHGEVGVSFLTDGGEREILPESELKLVDRTLQPGDFCKRSIDDVRSGVVTGVQVQGRVEHVISGESVGWKTLDDIEHRVEAEIGDYVVYDDWIGQVCQITTLMEKCTYPVSGH